MAPHSYLENPMDGGAWQAAVHGVAKTRTRLNDFTFTFHFHALEKEMATHSSVLAWRIPGAEELVGLWGRTESDTTEETQQQQQQQWIRLAADHQTVTLTFYAASLALGSALEFLLSPATELIITSCHIKSTFYCTSQSDREIVCCFFSQNKTTLQNDFLKICGCS